MVDLELLTRLEEKKLIKKQDIIWWQFGFEGRKIISEDEFNRTLQTVSYSCLKKWIKHGETFEKEVREFKVWPRNDVPVVIKKVKLGGEEIDAFVTINPMSHYGGSNTGWEDLKYYTSSDCEFPLPLPVYRTPHIRGVVTGRTREFLFWSPILNGQPELIYSTVALRAKDGGLPLLLSPIRTSKFYKNLIYHVWHGGKRTQKNAIELRIEEQGLQFVPYYAFDFTKEHVMVYPASVFQGKLDLPVIVRGNSSTGMPSILGVGYIFDRGDEYHESERGMHVARYWELAHSQERRAKNSLISRLGRVTSAAPF